MKPAFRILAVAFAAVAMTGARQDSGGLGRVNKGLLALYDFASDSGSVVRDRSGAGKPVDLRISDMKAVRRSKGALEVRGKTLIASDKAPSRILDAIRRSGEITIEAWILPSRTGQSGPARIVSISKDTSNRNVTLGQDGDKIDVRLRTTKTSSNGLPSVASKGKSVATRVMHVVYTRNRGGNARVYINGKENTRGRVQGEMSNWDRSHRLSLGNELTKNRPWLGTFHLVAIYDRDLSSVEVSRNFKAGAGAKTEPALAAAARNATSANNRLFETQVAPLLARHCLECHDTATRKGGLDLSRKDAALAGGKDGKVLVPGKLSASPLWESVSTDEMPKKRTPLRARDKEILKRWIEGGAEWSVNTIDPVVYARGVQEKQVWIRRLTVPEYIATVKAAVGVDIAGEARGILPPDLRADGFSNTAYNLNVDLKHVEAYARLAEIVVRRMDVVKFAARFSRSRRLTDKEMRGLIEKMGKWLLRGPMERHELDGYRGITTTVAHTGGGFPDAVRYVVQAMLQSPRFIYRIERQRGDGSPRPVDDYELASRMSYILWGAPPDAELMRAAEKGDLSGDGEIRDQVKRMLKDSRAIEQATRFIDEWLNLGRLDHLRPNRKHFPKWDPRTAADMREETRAFFREVAWKQNRPLSELLNAQVTFLTPRLARHYGLKPKGEGLQRYDLSSVPGRGGLLTHGSVLTIGGDEASMVTRGLFVLQNLLRGLVKDPPPGVDTTPVPTKPGLSQRGVAEARIADKTCGGCHGKFEPLAFGLEKFDGLGGWFEKDPHGNRLREDGEVLFPGTAKPAAYATSAELMNLLAGSDRVRESFTWKVTQFALGRSPGPADVRIMSGIHEAAQKGGGTYAALVTAIVMSDLVRMTWTEEEP